jgi:hypothetical protein
LSRGEKEIEFKNKDIGEFFRAYRVLAKYPKLAEAIAKVREYEIKGRFHKLIEDVLANVDKKDIRSAKFIEKVKAIDILANKIHQTSAAEPVFALQININNIEDRNAKIEEITKRIARMPAVRDKLERITGRFQDDPELIDLTKHEDVPDNENGMKQLMEGVEEEKDE